MSHCRNRLGGRDPHPFSSLICRRLKRASKADVRAVLIGLLASIPFRNNFHSCAVLEFFS